MEDVTQHLAHVLPPLVLAASTDPAGQRLFQAQAVEISRVVSTAGTALMPRADANRLRFGNSGRAAALRLSGVQTENRRRLVPDASEIQIEGTVVQTSQVPFRRADRATQSFQRSDDIEAVDLPTFWIVGERHR